MKILFVHSGSDLYGASRSLLRLTSRLVAEGHSIHVILPEKGPLVQELEQQCINVYIHTGLPIATREVFKRIKSILYLFFRIPGSIVKIMRMAHSSPGSHTYKYSSYSISGYCCISLSNSSHMACKGIFCRVWNILEFLSMVYAFILKDHCLCFYSDGSTISLIWTQGRYRSFA